MGIGQPRNLQNLRFADDVLLVGKSLPQVHKMLVGLSEEAAKAGLQVHMGKTKILSNVVRRRCFLWPDNRWPCYHWKGKWRT